MKKCLKCGAELDDGANFCRYCGSSQKVDSAEAIAQGYYAPNGMSQDYYDPNGTAQGYYAPNDMAQGYYDPNGTAQGYYDPNGMPQGYYDQNSMNPGVEQPVSKMPKSGKSREKKSNCTNTRFTFGRVFLLSFIFPVFWKRNDRQEQN